MEQQNGDPTEKIQQNIQRAGKECLEIIGILKSSKKISDVEANQLIGIIHDITITQFNNALRNADQKERMKALATVYDNLDKEYRALRDKLMEADPSQEAAFHALLIRQLQKPRN